ncbi:uncharacterized protein LOC110461942 [Mizuhopecten yessoensis]|uniref:Uncharacterized protein n=1 Tax=Mizuhopecten yessoensis TaxID=6573 RepID=A0A210R2S1_MIZYE|nr:uncharacterized protein LOC110461942 [Mizuhopecten yessoensis]XP_021371370.1 uncharacterized protein LOC110461942 [Mizuhopecten yessoensis]XP_021371379.1 uncharacterized protein LOC110461942 [Mizuhopecten yessoensis]OWF55299.1 hypothetical protein KP79_PYT16331 [Mizuhopecten yessoensis]
MNAKMVSSLFKIDGDSNKRKTLNTIRVMKGAISVSKSKTGEVIYRSNKLENEGLQRQIKRFEKARLHLNSTYDSKKRTTLRRWALVFEKQKSMNESIREFDMLLSQAIDNVESDDQNVPSAEKNRDSLELKLEDTKPENEEEEDMTEKKSDEEKAAELMSRRGITRLRLQPIGVGKNSQIKVKTPEPETPVIEEELWPLADTTWVNNYIREQKVKHESLITKNILKKIREGLTSKNPLFRFRLRANFADDPNVSIEIIKSARAGPQTARSVKTAPTMPTLPTRKDVIKPSTTMNDSSLNQLPPINMLRRSKTTL